LIVYWFLSTSVYSTVQIELILPETLKRPHILLLRVENDCQIHDLFIAIINGQPLRVASSGIRVIRVKSLTQILFKGNKI